MADETQSQAEDLDRKVLGILLAGFERARSTAPELMAVLAANPRQVAGWLAVLWLGACGKEPLDVDAELKRLIEIYSEMYSRGRAADGSEGEGEKRQSKQTKEARLLKGMGRSLDEICGALVSEYSKMSPAERGAERRRLCDRMRKQEAYERRASGSGRTARARRPRAGAAPPRES